MDRDLDLERRLIRIAAQAAGVSGDAGLRNFANRRSPLTPVDLPRDFDEETREEIADGVNYLTWGVQETYEQVLAGDGAACADYERRMRTLTLLVKAWHALHTGT